MKAVERQDIVKKGLLALWSLLTLVLLFVVGLLVMRLMEQREATAGITSIQPAAGAGEAGSGTEPGEPAAADGRPREIQLYFADANGEYLNPEPRTLDLGAHVASNCRAALEALIAGPSAGGTAILPPGTEINACYYLEDTDELVIDFSSDVVSGYLPVKSAVVEALLVYGIVNTLTQGALQNSREVVRQVRFLVEGYSPPESFAAHLDMSEAFMPDPRWLQPAPAPVGEA